MFKKLIMSVASIVAFSGVPAYAQEAPDDLIRRSTNEILAAIKADKTMCGRGSEIEWRISHEELVRYQNEGLRPVPDHY